MSGLIAVESYRQAIRNNKVLVMVVIALSVLCVCLTLALVSIFPLKTIEKELYEFSSSGQTFYRVESARDLVSRNNMLISMAARQYISYRETIDRLTEEQRFQSVREMSSDEMFANLQKSYTLVSEALGERGKRKITIELDNFFNSNPTLNVHVVEFKTDDTFKNGETTTNYWQAVIGYQFNEQKIRLDDLVQNPLGFEVVNYSITKRNPLN